MKGWKHCVSVTIGSSMRACSGFVWTCDFMSLRPCAEKMFDNVCVTIGVGKWVNYVEKLW